MKRIHLIQAIGLIFIAIACNKDPVINVSVDVISGHAQKGPYLNGTAVTFSELSGELYPTGKNYFSQILDNKGTFEIRSVNFASQYVLIRADGFYFDEVANSNSCAPLTLFALSDLTNNSAINVNVLTDLEKNRVMKLVSTGMRFSEAKQQAENEILSIFEITKSDIIDPELLDIAGNSEDNAILIAVSVILQGYLPVADLSELLANISTDIREDGVLNSRTLGSILINNAKLIKLDKIRQNLVGRYESMGMNIAVPDFEKYVQQFIAKTDFEFTGFIMYPASGKFGANILDKNVTEYQAGTYSMKAVLPEGTSLKVSITGTNWFFHAFQTDTGWTFSSWNETDYSRTFFSSRTGEIDFEILLGGALAKTPPRKIRLTAYENDAAEPTWTKEITINF